MSNQSDGRIREESFVSLPPQLIPLFLPAQDTAARANAVDQIVCKWRYLALAAGPIP